MLLQLIGAAALGYCLVKLVRWAIKQDIRERVTRRLNELWKKK